MNPTLKKTLKIISNTLVILTVLLAFLLYGVQLLGITPYSVMSGSMGSACPVESLVYVVKAGPEKLEINDVITYKDANGIPVTHRLVEFVPDETDPDIIRLRTKGDANLSADPLVDYESVVGKVIFCIPSLGRLAMDISYPPGKYVALTIVAALILLEIIIHIALDDKDNKKPATQQK